MKNEAEICDAGLMADAHFIYLLMPCQNLWAGTELRWVTYANPGSAVQVHH